MAVSRRMRLATFAVSSLSALAWASTASAQETDAANTGASASPINAANSVIIVTAQKREETLLEVPASVSAVTGDRLEDLGVTGFDDYATYIPGLNQQPAGGPGARALVLRGISAGNDPAATVGIYVDDVQFGSSSSLAAGGRLALDLVPFDLERIEVLRGPQGTLYGASTLGGLFKYVTRAPDPSGWAGRTQIDFRDLDRGESAFGVRGAINVPIAEDVAALRFTGYYQENAGYVDNLTLGSDINGSEQYGGRASLLVNLTPELDVRLSVVAQDIETDDIATVLYDPTTRRPVFGELIQNSNISASLEQEYRQYSGIVNWDFGFATLTSITSYATFDTPFIQDFSFSTFGAALGAPTIFSAAAQTDKFVQEIRLTSAPNDRFEWLVGGFYTDEDSSSNQQVIVQGGPFAVLNPIIDVQFPSTFEELAFFGNATVYLSDRFDITFGIRYSENDQTNAQITVSNLPVIPSGVIAGASSDSTVTYLINPRFRISDDVHIYARAASGYRPGGPNAVLNDPITGQPLAPTSFEPDTLWNYEIGIKSELLDRRLTANLAFFHIDWEDIQLIQILNGASFRGNGGTARSQGFEGELVYRFGERLIVGGNIAYTSAELTEDTQPVVGGLDGDPLPLVPDWSGAIFADYSFPLSGEVSALLGASARFVGSRQSSFSASPSNPNFRLEGYASVDLRAGIRWNDLDLTLFVRNLTNEIPQLNATTRPGFNRVDVVVGQPRSIGLTLNAAF